MEVGGWGLEVGGWRLEVGVKEILGHVRLGGNSSGLAWHFYVTSVHFFAKLVIDINY